MKTYPKTSTESLPSSLEEKKQSLGLFVKSFFNRLSIEQLLLKKDLIISLEDPKEDPEHVLSTIANLFKEDKEPPIEHVQTVFKNNEGSTVIDFCTNAFNNALYTQAFEEFQDWYTSLPIDERVQIEHA